MRNVLILFTIFNFYYPCISSDNYNKDQKYPTILVASLIRNKVHTLPYFFSYLENQNYPKDRLALWFRSDHNEDNSIELIHTWLNKTADLYHNVDFKYEEYPFRHINETTPMDWPKERFSHIIKLKEEAFEKANQLWADFIFFIDADVFLTYPDTLKHLVSYNLPVVAPMLLSEGLYSNYWCGMSDDYYYQRTEDYKKIYHSEITGHFAVPMVHSAVLVNINYLHSYLLTFDRQKLLANQRKLGNVSKIYDGPLDDIIIFAISANTSGIPMYIINEHAFGYFLAPLEREEELHRDFQQLLNLKLIIINDMNQRMRLNNEFKNFVYYPEKHKMSVDHIYMINLERRPERRRKMELCFKELGLDVEHFPAIDGKNLSLVNIKSLGIKMLPGYEDPYHQRPMTIGEIGCFLSHYNIWKKIIELGQKEVFIIEDDIRFEPYFIEKSISVLEQARKLDGWDLIYFGRKRLEDQDEPWVENAQNLVKVGYSYWTLGYVITLEGAKKLVNINPLEKLLPVDEFLPIMFNRHPNDTWASYFNPKNLNALSVAPLLIYPTHYTGDEGYISDTEDSVVTPKKLFEMEGQLKSDKERNQGHFQALMDETNMNIKHIPITKNLGTRDPGDL